MTTLSKEDRIQLWDMFLSIEALYAKSKSKKIKKYIKKWMLTKWTRKFWFKHLNNKHLRDKNIYGKR